MIQKFIDRCLVSIKFFNRLLSMNLLVTGMCFNISNAVHLWKLQIITIWIRWKVLSAVQKLGMQNLLITIEAKQIMNKNKFNWTFQEFQHLFIFFYGLNKHYSSSTSVKSYGLKICFKLSISLTCSLFSNSHWRQSTFSSQSNKAGSASTCNPTFGKQGIWEISTQKFLQFLKEWLHLCFKRFSINKIKCIGSNTQRKLKSQRLRISARTYFSSKL